MNLSAELTSLVASWVASGRTRADLVARIGADRTQLYRWTLDPRPSVPGLNHLTALLRETGADPDLSREIYRLAGYDVPALASVAGLTVSTPLTPIAAGDSGGPLT